MKFWKDVGVAINDSMKAQARRGAKKCRALSYDLRLARRIGGTGRPPGWNEAVR